MTKQKDFDLRASGKLRALDARDAWLSVPEAAHELAASRATVRRWCSSARLDARLVTGPSGPQYQISAASVRACLSQRKAAQAAHEGAQAAHPLTRASRSPIPLTDPATVSRSSRSQAAHCNRCKGAHLAAKTAARRMGDAQAQVILLQAENAFLKRHLEQLTRALERLSAPRPWWRFWRR